MTHDTEDGLELGYSPYNEFMDDLETARGIVIGLYISGLVWVCALAMLMAFGVI